MTEAIILAGGLGTRLQGTVPGVPKPMAPVHGRPFLEYQLDYWIGQGVERFVLSVGYMHEVIVSHFGAAYRDVPIDYAIEHSPLGTGGGLFLAAQKLRSDNAFLLLNGDTYFEAELSALRSFHEARNADWTFSLIRAAAAGRYMAMDIELGGRISSLKGIAGEAGQLANGGVYVVNPEALRASRWSTGDRLSLEDDMLPELLTSGSLLVGLECTGTFIDIGVREDYLRVPSILAM